MSLSSEKVHEEGYTAGEMGHFCRRTCGLWGVACRGSLQGGFGRDRTAYVFESEVERELVNVFAAVGRYDLKPDMDEVEEGRFWRMDEIEENLGKSLFTPNFEGEFVRIKDSLLALL